MTESELSVSERSVRRGEKKASEEAAKAEEKAKRLAEKKAIADSKSKSKGDAEDKEEKEVVVQKVECFGEEIQPDFAAGKDAEQLLTQLDCIWDGPVTYELQVCYMT